MGKEADRTDDGTYQKWLDEIDSIFNAQQSDVPSTEREHSLKEKVISALEGQLSATRICPHCQWQGIVSRGRSNGLRRFHCAGCGRTFNALTGTPLANLHHKERWLDFTRALDEHDTVRLSAARCDLAVSTAFRWRHRFLRAIETDSAPLRGIVETGETQVPSSRKGDPLRNKTNAVGAGDGPAGSKPGRR